jgi:DNA-binding CsgD family transcriptional regulator
VGGGGGATSSFTAACQAATGGNPFLLGELLRTRSDDATAPRRRRAQLADRCGARALATAAREELVASGARPRRAARSGVDALTPSERRVARMAAEGLGNREIAQALFVTVRTVEGYLTNVYQKLAIGSRDQLAEALADGARAS